MGSWYLSKPQSPYHPPKLVPGEVSQASLHWHRYTPTADAAVTPTRCTLPLSHDTEGCHHNHIVPILSPFSLLTCSANYCRRHSSLLSGWIFPRRGCWKTIYIFVMFEGIDTFQGLLVNLDLRRTGYRLTPRIKYHLYFFNTDGQPKALSGGLEGIEQLLQIKLTDGDNITVSSIGLQHVTNESPRVFACRRCSELKRLSDDNLARQPDEVFDTICKIGRGSYGSVYKALHKETGQVLAIKQVPVDTDLQEIIKEISIMQQCDSTYIVKYYGSYFKNQDLWIVMEYCGAGSVSDIMRLRNKTDTMAKRNTVIGTPYWMAPEVIQEIGYDCVADIWSLGITALEMAEGKPPYGDIHPMRAIFMIPTKPPPSFRKPDKWSPEFIDFVSKCLVKNPELRATAAELLEHDFIKNRAPCTVLLQMIQEAKEILEAQANIVINGDDSGDEDEADGTMVKKTDQEGTMKAQPECTFFLSFRMML
ncbi:serine/threonine-protein kinase 3 [Elysia marginata]|uniref:non-specific serine/threonine protein kinase n=1 Tax=Elysia marginata TaxID=1093978 RepID=A0AAV4ESK4_9GAST|nr:serine/threonine-protein kinase 3 [Elysia marginata]